MATKIQIKRNIGNTAVAKPTLLAGELAWAKGGFIGDGANGLVVGDGTADQVLVGASRQVELTGNQTIASGTKTFAPGAKLSVGVADLKVPGGNADEVLTTDGAGNLTWAVAQAGSSAADGTTIVDDGTSISVNVAGIADGVTIYENAGKKLAVTKATLADIDNAVADHFVDALQLENGVLGAKLAALTTTAKKVVPAINELRTEIGALTGVMIFAGTLDASTGAITAASGVPNVPANISAVVPAQTKNYVFIVTVAGSNVGTGNTKAAAKQDWVASDGTKLVTLNYGLQAVVAANVQYTPGMNVYAVSNNVQAAIDELDVALRGPIDGGVF